MQRRADAHPKKPKRHRTLRASPTGLDSHAQALNLICFATCQEASFACEIHPAAASVYVSKRSGEYGGSWF